MQLETLRTANMLHSKIVELKESIEARNKGEYDPRFLISEPCWNQVKQLAITDLQTQLAQAGKELDELKD